MKMFSIYFKPNSPASQYLVYLLCFWLLLGCNRVFWESISYSIQPRFLFPNFFNRVLWYLKITFLQLVTISYKLSVGLSSEMFSGQSSILMIFKKFWTIFDWWSTIMGKYWALMNMQFQFLLQYFHIPSAIRHCSWKQEVESCCSRFRHDAPNHLTWWVLHSLNCIHYIKPPMIFIV